MIFDLIKKTRPELLDFSARATTVDLKSWSDLNMPQLHESLKDLWLTYGTGTVFETEEFYSPVPDPDTGESANSLNERLWGRGLNKDYIVFHSGLGGFACMDSEGVIRLLNEGNLEESKTFESLENWFQNSLVAEYAERYSLGVHLGEET